MSFDGCFRDYNRNRIQRQEMEYSGTFLSLHQLTVLASTREPRAISFSLISMRNPRCSIEIPSPAGPKWETSGAWGRKANEGVSAVSKQTNPRLYPSLTSPTSCSFHHETTQHFKVLKFAALYILARLFKGLLRSGVWGIFMHRHYKASSHGPPHFHFHLHLHLFIWRTLLSDVTYKRSGVGAVKLVKNRAITQDGVSKRRAGGNATAAPSATSKCKSWFGKYFNNNKISIRNRRRRRQLWQWWCDQGLNLES